MSIPVSMLNSTVDIIQFAAGAKTGMGEHKRSSSNVATGVKCRITRNKEFNNAVSGVEGYIASSSHKIFFNVGVSVDEGQYVKHGTTLYSVKYVDKMPGGVSDHHIEAYCALSEVDE